MEVPMPRLASGLDLTDLGARIRSERLRRHLSLEALSSQSGVSSSMLSDIERGKKVPSVLVLDSIATALGTSLARLLEEEQHAKVIVLRHREQEVVQDPSGWERRILSPVLPGIEFEFMRTTILPGVDAGVFLPHGTGSREYIAVEEGTLQLTLNGTVYLLQAGDSIYYAGDCQHAFANPGEKPCTYYLVMEIPPSPVPHVHHR
ncbi:XRE family transcriptional regulator [Ktedonobacter sp. SOSP1-52]|uniref:helix-turn-helix domain-containing protein n=1 Tax=Ktedonobacter sp. SOSP1-52 TaxID=2778366 RepID=UPI0019164E70|nr:XRE family transcriptional regulator [Ktedonobacter sp. SOSP1-52]GHO65223.1 XRE family transcriptional regulator [Ktedonobacter sp. SOSP1-52]